MNYKLVLKTYAQLRQLTEDERTRLDELMNMTDAERELLVATLGPPVKAKSTKPATGRKIEYCAAEGCGFTKRAVVHKDSSAAGYHEFQQPSSSSKSRRASGIAATLGNRSRKPPQPAMCVECGESDLHSNHELGGHEFTTDLAGRVNGVLDKHSGKCSALLTDGTTCGAASDDLIHDEAMGYGGYHEFVGSETAVGVGGD